MLPIRIGIIGSGSMAKSHADQFRRLPGVELTSCLDVVPGRAAEFAEKNSVKQSAGDLAELLSQVDAVAVVTPDRFHAEPTIEALRAGKHVLCEKPLTVSLAEARMVAKEARKASTRGQIHMVNFSYRASAAFQRAMVIQKSGKLGKLRHVHSHYLQSWLTQSAWGDWTGDAMLWRLQKAKGSGGVLGDLGCHILDLTTAVAEEVRAVRCDLRTFPKLVGGQEVTEYQGACLDANDSAVIELEFVGGAVGVVHTTRWATGHLNHLRCEVHGSAGAMRFDLDQDYNTIEVCHGRGLEKAKWKASKLKPTPGNWQRFIRAIRRGRPDQPDMLRGAHIQAYIDACERSARLGRWVTVPKMQE